MSEIFRHWKKQQYTELLLSKLEQWFDSDRGERMLACQRQLLRDLLASHFGYHLLQLSVDSRVSLVEDCRVQNKYRCHPYAHSSDTLCNFEQLPFANESLDVVLLHHIHEFVSSPHQLLREIQRVTVPHGRLVVIGFNPWSPLGAYSNVGYMLPTSVWQNHLISSRRMKDWLGLLGFDTEVCEFGCHSPQILECTDKARFNRLLKRWPFGNFYIISAVKQVATMTPVKLKWRNTNTRFAGLSPIKTRVGGHSAKTLVPIQPNHKEDVA